MAITHRKLLQQQDSDQNSTCSDCGPTCRYNCSYSDFYWPPQPPPIPQHPITTTITHTSPYVIIIVTLLASAFLFFSYYLIMVTCSTHFRRAPSRQEDSFSDQDQGLELEAEHPIWYINTIGLQPSVINSISVFNYNKHDNLIDSTDCSVCLIEFQDNDVLRLLPKCNHAFHVPCIDTWLSSHVNCPLCRAGILSNTLSSDNHNSFLTTNGSNLVTQMGDLEDGAESGGNIVPEIENCDEIEDSKTEYESVVGARRSVSVESVAITDVIVGEIGGVAGDSTVNIVISDSRETS